MLLHSCNGTYFLTTKMKIKSFCLTRISLHWKMSPSQPITTAETNQYFKRKKTLKLLPTVKC